jgi:hypothetical protein
VSAAKCPYCHPHCVRCDASSDCALCPCRKTRPIVAAKVKVVVGQRYMLRQGRAVPGERRVGSGEIVTVVGAQPSGAYTVMSHDGITVSGVAANELGRNK